MNMKPIVTTSLNCTTMESLSLPQDLYWDGKMEPISPPSSELFLINGSNIDWLYDDNFASELTLLSDDTAMEFKIGVDSSEELFNSDDDLVIQPCNPKEEHWNDIKPSSQLLDFPIGTIIAHPNTLTKVQNTIDVGTFAATNFDNAVLTQLTPPHSPPQTVASSAFPNAPIDTSTNVNDAFQVSSTPPLASPVQIVTNEKFESSAVQPTFLNFNNWQQQQQQQQHQQQQQNQHSTVGALNNEFNVDIAREMQIVDEIVNKRVKELFDSNNDDCESMSSYSAPSQIESSTDEEWTPCSSYSSAGSSPAHNTCEESSLKTTATNASKKRTRPYGRGIEDRKLRKKEQNKNAATRYRQKKKLEMENVLSEEQQLTQRNDELKRILSDRKREEKYLKTLIREFYAKKQ